MSITLTPDTVSDLRARVQKHGLRAVAHACDLSINTIKKALSSGNVSSKTAVALRRTPPRVRHEGDFARVPRVTPPTARATATSWSLEAIRAAIDAQMRGDFARPKQLAEAMRRDDAIFVARSNRIAPIASVASELRPHDSDRGRNVAVKAAVSVQVARTTLAGIAGTLVDHAVAIGYVEHEPNADGTRIDMRLTEWPLEHVRWNNTEQRLETATRNGSIVPIVHGDGRWIVFRHYAYMPWREDACVLPAAFVWASHAEGVSDWAASSRAHGLAKIIGELPEGNAINETDGTLPTATQEFYEMLRALAEGDTPVALRPSGAKTEFLASSSNAWQVFRENIVSREKAAARIYLGTDAILGSVGGAPGVDISALFGVATTKLQGTFSAIEAGLITGLYEPWCAINFGDTHYAPSLRFLLPDPDLDSKRNEVATNITRLTEAIKALREQKLDVTQAVVDALARDLGVSPVPQMAALEQQSTSITLAPTDVAKVVRVREARSSQGLPPFGDERDDLTISELDARSTAAARAPAPAEPAA